MRDLSPVIAAGCGLAVVCIGLIAIVGFMVVRFTGRSFLGPVLGTFLGGQDAPEDRPAPTIRAQSSGKDLRSLAKSLDFDSAVQKYRQQGGVQNPPDPDYTVSPTPPPVDDFDKSRYGVRDTENSANRMLRDRRYRRNADESQDEVLGSLFDGEDDN